jgi:hypothetical protein
MRSWKSCGERLIGRLGGNWDLRVAPSIPAEEKSRATVYFPIADDLHSFDSTLGRWRWKSVRLEHQQLYDILLALQPFTSPANRWLAIREAEEAKKP